MSVKRPSFVEMVAYGKKQQNKLKRNWLKQLVEDNTL